MDFGVVGFDGLGGCFSDSGFPFAATSSAADQEAEKHKWLYGSGSHRQGRSADEGEDWRSSKLAKTDDFSASKATQQQHQQQQLLSFSNSPNSESILVEKNATMPYFHQTLSAYNTSSAGQNTGSLSSGGAAMHWSLAGGRGPFTPSQWMELEHQALIYKYITANMPIPSNLLFPIKKALDSAGFSTFPNGLLRPNSLGWGSIHLGFSNNTDPEPGRCRRTDGKKWRCWRDAVPDQKYCERHMNRGRHRSRKPVEGHTGHTGTTTTTTSKQPLASSSSTSVVSVPGGGGGSSLAVANQQLKSLQQPAASNSSAATTKTSRMFMNKEKAGARIQHTPGLSKENPFLTQKQQIGHEESPRTEFGLVLSDSLLNPSQKTSYPAETNSQHHSLRHFIDDCPKTQSDCQPVSWPNQLDMQSDRTQLSISIPIASSTGNETLSPLHLPRELESPASMGLGVGSGHALSEQNNIKQTNWIPSAWETSLGGPLGEVLHNSNSSNSAAEYKNNSSVLNLMTGGSWDNNNNSPSPLGSSPTGVLQKTAFGSLSNSSAGSSPRAENNNRSHEGFSLLQ
ncbi:growth-regulating factor 1-like [Pyrus x bretschneideri]|uniref:growth-regulating factor 1-like n=1 Tax=Pyrus x bretschneideri TaxID=225117 RepID=UPI00202E544E|nr:growth-regulating factor 1-like [Pyrus x bretschneideri]